MISDLFLFKGLKEKEIKEIISFLDSPVHFNKGDTIYSADKFEKALGYIIKGKASAVTDNDDGFFMKAFPKGSVFGAAAVFGNGDTYVSHIVANTDTEVMFINEQTLKKIFEKYPKTSINYINFLSDKIRFLNRKLRMISCTSAEDVVYKYLIDNMPDSKIVKIPVSFTLLAKMLGLSRATLYRGFDALEQKGKIKREKNIIKVI
ncbi:MAG: Crp/Fnr family transcriptional regulator [Clostridia bacterium]|nr:Crp/Fnr family transcriptional regulator [Clostridia bacterium]